MPTGMWLISYLALWVLLLAVSILLVAVIRQVRELHTYWVVNDPAWGLPHGAPAPALPGEDMSGRPLVLGAERGKKTVLLFLSRGCKACDQTMAAMPVLATRDDFQLVLVVRGNPLETRLFLAEFKREIYFTHIPAVADVERRLAEQYQVLAVPYSVVVDEDGRIGATGTGLLLDQIDALKRETDERREARLATAGEPSSESAEAAGPVSEPVAA